MYEPELYIVLLILCGCIGALIVVVCALAAALYLRYRDAARVSYCSPPPPAPVVEPEHPTTSDPEDEAERLRKAQAEFEAEQAAFQRLLGYNAAVAYGLGSNGGEP